MKFFALLIAAVAAVKIETPNESYAAKADSVAAATAATTTQKAFEGDHLAMHTNNMNTAEAENQALKAHVRKARADQVAGGNQYPPLKTYDAGKKWGPKDKLSVLNNSMNRAPNWQNEEDVV